MSIYLALKELSFSDTYKLLVTIFPLCKAVEKLGKVSKIKENKLIERNEKLCAQRKVKQNKKELNVTNVYPSSHQMSVCLVNFINVVRAHFLYERHFL